MLLTRKTLSQHAKAQPLLYSYSYLVPVHTKKWHSSESFHLIIMNFLVHFFIYTVSSTHDTVKIYSLNANSALCPFMIINNFVRAWSAQYVRSVQHITCSKKITGRLVWTLLLSCPYSGYSSTSSSWTGRVCWWAWGRWWWSCAQQILNSGSAGTAAETWDSWGI